MDGRTGWIPWCQLDHEHAKGEKVGIGDQCLGMVADAKMMMKSNPFQMASLGL